MECRLRQALDPDEPGDELERAAGVRDVADELRDLSYKLVPPSRPGQTTPT
jgi:hypothetical protein